MGVYHNMKRKFLKSLNSERGVTFVETVISLLLLSLIMISLFRIGTSLLPPLAKGRAHFSSLGKEMLLYKGLEGSLNRINPPWWLEGYQPLLEEDRVVFSWYKGEANNTLEITRTDEELRINTSDEILLSLMNPPSCHFQWEESGKSRLGFLKVRMSDHNLIFPIANGTIPKDGAE
jgi:hypothetical protein